MYIHNRPFPVIIFAFTNRRGGKKPKRETSTADTPKDVCNGSQQQNRYAKQVPPSMNNLVGNLFATAMDLSTTLPK